MDYLDISLAKTRMYNMELSIYNKDITNLRKSIVKEIVENGGIMMNDVMETRNNHRMFVYIPKLNIVNFVENIKLYGTITNETLTYTDRNRDTGINEVEMRLDNARNMIGKFNALLANAESIADKITLEKEIYNTQNEIEMMELRKKDMEIRIENVAVSILLHK
jgi:hypothetical protein